ncbi:hypothetical protein [Xanthomonas sp. D-99]|uniref:hypothetical protein n=1 Tax=Xanthomonas sp. D-99 TaxID=2821273 RepID=UPI001ADBADF3|nr:hypothetical protein [Xanthomonas sp. D-99]MBO9878401.1 hypothetical protein [Xanthomonas sp. D-99]
MVVEGITDFYALSIALKFSDKISRLAFIPGVGSGASGLQISLLLGRGDAFTVMLDDDKAGKTSANKYRAEWYLTNQSVFTVGELLPDFKSKRLEGFLSEALVEDIMAQQSLTSRPSKKQIGLFLAEKFSSGAEKNPFDNETQSRFEKLLQALQDRFPT